MLVRLLIATCLIASFVPADDDDDEEKFALPPRLVKLDLPNSTLGKVASQLSQKAGIPFTFPAAAAGEMKRGDAGKKTKPIQSAPACTAVSNATGSLMPHILTRVVIR